MSVQKVGKWVGGKKEGQMRLKVTLGTPKELRLWFPGPHDTHRGQNMGCGPRRARVQICPGLIPGSDTLGRTESQYPSPQKAGGNTSQQVVRRTEGEAQGHT